jgi:hypothetical protein
MIGLSVGVVFSIVFAIGSVLVGGVPAADDTMIPPISAAAMYITCCGGGGVLAGLLQSLFKTRIGSILGGAIATTPVLIGSAAIYANSLLNIDWTFVAVGALVFGIPAGLAFRRDYQWIQNLVRPTSSSERGAASEQSQGR